MPFRKRSQCTSDEAVQYLESYFATVDLVTAALSKFETLATDAKTAELRSLFRSKALEAERDLELLKNRRRAFLNEQSAIDPPSPAAVQETIDRAKALAAIQAKEAKANAIIALLTEGVDAFNRMHAA